MNVNFRSINNFKHFFILFRVLGNSPNIISHPFSQGREEITPGILTSFGTQLKPPIPSRNSVGKELYSGNLKKQTRKIEKVEACITHCPSNKFARYRVFGSQDTIARTGSSRLPEPSISLDFYFNIARK